MNLHRKHIPILVLILVLLGCSLPALPFLKSKPTPAGPIEPVFVNHPAPSLSMDLTPFAEAGCKFDPQGALRCPPNLPPFDKLAVLRSSKVGLQHPHRVACIASLADAPQQPLHQHELHLAAGPRALPGAAIVLDALRAPLGHVWLDLVGRQEVGVLVDGDVGRPRDAVVGSLDDALGRLACSLLQLQPVLDDGLLAEVRVVQDACRAVEEPGLHPEP